MPLVVDASVTMAWCFEDEASPATEAVLDGLADDVAIVPHIWHLEVANVLMVAERRRRISEAQGSRFIQLLEQLPIKTYATDAPMDQIVAVARRHNLSAYDASYLVLAERLGVQLATNDRRVTEACMAAGVALAIS